MSNLTEASAAAGLLCLECGLCCNGVLFRDVEVRDGDDPARLKSLGLPVVQPKGTGKVPRFAQPCAALCADGKCGVYAERPSRCRNYECALFKAVAGQIVTTVTASKIIRKTKRQSGKVLRLLRLLGDTEEGLALSLRFKQLKRRIESGPLDEETADGYGELTLAIHELNVLLHQHFHVTEPAGAKAGS